MNKNKLFLVMSLLLVYKINYSYTPQNPMPPSMYPYYLYGTPNSFDNIEFYADGFSVIGPGSLILTNETAGQTLLGTSGSITQTSSLSLAAQGINSTGISASGGTISIVDVTTFSVSNTGANSVAIEIADTGILNITGNSFMITNSGDSSIGIAAANTTTLQSDTLTLTNTGDNSVGIQSSGKDVKIDITNFATITSTGYAITTATNDAEISIKGGVGSTVSISTTGNSSTSAVHTGGNRSSITIEGSTVNLSATGNGSNLYAVSTEADSSLVSIKGDSITAKSNYKALSAFGNNSNIKISNLNTSSGTIIIEGGANAIYTTANANIDIQGKKINLSGHGSSGNSTIQSDDSSKITVIGDNINLKTTTGTGSIIQSNETSEVIIEGTSNTSALRAIGDIVANDTSTVTTKYNGTSSYLTGIITTAADATTNMTLSDGAKWNIKGDSNVTNVIANNSTFDLSKDSSKKTTININSITGTNNTFIMKMYPETPDFLNIKNASEISKNTMEIAKESVPSLLNHDFKDSPIYFADVNSKISFKSNTFGASGYLYDYTVELSYNDIDSSNGDNWFIVGVKKTDESENSGNSDSSDDNHHIDVNETTKKVQKFTALRYADASMINLEIDSLYKRLGDIRNYKDKQGVWARNTSGKMKNDGNLINKYYMTQVGYDKMDEVSFGKSFTGIAFQYRYSDLDFSDGNGKGNSYGLSLYKTYFTKDNQYLDLIGKYTYIENKLYTIDRYGDSINGKYHTLAGTLGVEYGKRIYSKNKNYYLQPIVQIKYTHLESVSYTTNSGFKIHEDSVNSFVGKIGFYTGVEINNFNNFIKVAVLREFTGHYAGTIKGYDGKVSSDNTAKDNWIELGIGGDYKVNEDFFIYYEIDKTFNADYNIEIQGTIGLRYSFN